MTESPAYQSLGSGISWTPTSEPYNDWSKVRSPSRTLRRLKKGHPNKNIRRLINVEVKVSLSATNRIWDIDYISVLPKPETEAFPTQMPPVINVQM